MRMYKILIKFCIMTILIINLSDAQSGSVLSSTIDNLPVVGHYNIPSYVDSGVSAYKMAQNVNKFTNIVGLAPIMQHPTTIQYGTDFGLAALQSAQNLNQAYSNFVDSDFVGLPLMTKMLPKGLPYVSNLSVPPKGPARLVAVPASLILLSPNPFSHLLQRRSIQEEDNPEINQEKNEAEILNPIEQPNASDEVKEVLSSSGSAATLEANDESHQAKIRSPDNENEFDYLSKAADPTDGYEDLKNKFSSLMKKVGKEMKGAAKKVETTIWPSHAESAAKEAGNPYSIRIDNAEMKTDEFNENPYSVWVDNAEVNGNANIKSNVDSVGGLMQKYLGVMNDKHVAKVHHEPTGNLAPGLRNAMDEFQKSLSESTLMNKYKSASEKNIENEKGGTYRMDSAKYYQNEKARPQEKLSTSKSAEKDSSEISKKVSDTWNKATDLASSIKDVVNSGKEEINKYVGTAHHAKPDYHHHHHHHHHTPNYNTYQDGIQYYYPTYSSPHKIYKPYYHKYPKSNDGYTNQRVDPSSVVHQALNLASGIWSNDPKKITNAGVGLGGAISNADPAYYPSRIFRQVDGKLVDTTVYPTDETENKLDKRDIDSDPMMVQRAAALAASILNGNEGDMGDAYMGNSDTSGAVTGFDQSRNFRQIDPRLFGSALSLADVIVGASRRDPSQINSETVFSDIQNIGFASSGLASDVTRNSQAMKPKVDLPISKIGDLSSSIVKSALKSKDDALVGAANPKDATMKNVFKSAKELTGVAAKTANLDKNVQNYAKASIDLAGAVTHVAMDPQNVGNIPLGGSKNPITAQWSPYFGQIVNLAAGRGAYGNAPMIQAYNPYMMPNAYQGFMVPLGSLWGPGLQMAGDITKAATSLKNN